MSAFASLLSVATRPLSSRTVVRSAAQSASRESFLITLLRALSSLGV